MEIELKNWVLKLRSEGACVSGDAIMKQGVKIYNKIHPISDQRTDEQQQICSDNRVNFQGSRGWFMNFMKQHNFSYRRISSTGRDLPSNTIELCYEFYKEVSFFDVCFLSYSVLTLSVSFRLQLPLSCTNSPPLKLSTWMNLQSISTALARIPTM